MRLLCDFMGRYGDNCEKHDLPYGECIECVREENSSLFRQLNERNERNGKLKDGLKQLKLEWEAQEKFLNNSHDHAEDRAAGRTYKECADILESRFGI